MIRTVTATRYVTPLREGGSLPAIIEADDDGMYVLKFRGAGQGRKALIAELVAGEIGRGLGLPVPEIVFVELDPRLGRSEPDYEIQELVNNSAGLNLALDYLPGALAFDPLLAPPPDPELAAAIVWFDAYTTNVDRTPRNTNMLVWHRQVYLIDHGAALFFHHTWSDYRARSRSRFTQVREHVLLPFTGDLRSADARLRPIVTRELIESIVNTIPDSWLEGEPGFADIAALREAYLVYLMSRLEEPRLFVEEAVHARAQLV